ncbi:MAG: TonB family protein [Verrucomicrobiota bacterium]|nr:TonB family protein [Verrucomicrobiota bacterium]
MKRDIFIAMFLAAFFHVAVLFGERLFAKTQHVVSTTTVEEVLLVSDAKQEEEPPPPPTSGEESEVLPEEFVAASLGEPPPSAVTLGALTMAIRPDKPRPPRPDGDGRFTVPTSGMKGEVGTSATKITNIFDASQLDQKPQERYAPSPRYPFNLTRAGIEGTVVVTFLVNEKGRVMIDSVNFESTPHKDFEASVTDALKQTQFAPGLVKGKPVIFKMRRPFVFNLSNQR